MIDQLVNQLYHLSLPKIPNHFIVSNRRVAISNAVRSIVVLIAPMCLIQLEFCRPENQATPPWPSCQHPLYFCINFGLLRKSARLEFRNLLSFLVNFNFCMNLKCEIARSTGSRRMETPVPLKFSITSSRSSFEHFKNYFSVL